MSTEYSALWSALRTLELTRQFTSARVEASKAYYTNIPGKLGDDAKKTIHRRHQKLASALALIGESSSDANTVTACSVEMSFLKRDDEVADSVDPAMVVLRLAQNKMIGEAELGKLQSLVDGLVREISMQQPNVWAVKDGASFLVWLKFKFQCLHPDRHYTTNFIIVNFLLPQVVERCRHKISHILNGPYSGTFRRWHADFVDSEAPDPTILSSSRIIISCTSDRVSTFQNAEDVVRAIAHAFVIADLCTDTLESQWATYDSDTYGHRTVVDAPETQDDVEGEQIDGGRMDVDTEEYDDRESLDPEDMNKSSIYRFIRKLSRYYISCGVITSELVALVRSGAGVSIKVETVPVSITSSTPAKENEYPSLESFLKQRMQMDVNSLDSQKVDRLRDSWPHDRKSQNLFLHAEMQIALFYALNPQLCPIRGFIGLSKKCCWCCDFVLKSVTMAHLTRRYIYTLTRRLRHPSTGGRYTHDLDGPPLLFSVSGTHNSKYTAWVFPDPATHIKHHSLDSTSFDKVYHRFKLVRRDLEDALVDEVNGIMGQLQKLEYESDSSGMSGPAGLGSHLMVLKADDAVNRKRKRGADGGHKNKDD